MLWSQNSQKSKDWPKKQKVFLPVVSCLNRLTSEPWSYLKELNHFSYLYSSFYNSSRFSENNCVQSMWYLKLLAIMKTTESFSICALLHWETVQQWKQQSDWFGTCCHCSNTSSLLSSVFLCNWVWAGVDRARPCFGNGSPDSGPEVSCLCLCLSSGSLSECHAAARLDICGRQIEMQVVIVIRMIDASLLVSHEPEAWGGVYCRVHMQNIYSRKHTHTLPMTQRKACGGECI